MIKNLPLSFVDFGIQPEEKFAIEVIQAREEGKGEFFDWDKLRKEFA